MKKIMVGVLLGLVVLLVLVALGITFFLDGAIKRGVETFGPRFTKVDVGLQSVKLSLLTGSGKIQGLRVGNPEGFKTPEAMKVGTLSLSLKPGSLLSDKIVINSIQIESPEVTFETDFKNNNLKKIQANLDETTGGGKAPPAPSPSAQAKEEKAANRKLQVDELLVSGGKVHVSLSALGGQSATVPLPEIHLTNLGQGPDGITTAELAKKVIQAIKDGAEQSAGGALSNLGKTSTNGLGRISKGIGSLLKGN